MSARRKEQDRARVTWYGHSAFLVQSPSGKNILIDPWLENPKAPAGISENVPADIILVTHGHGDHIGQTVELAQRTHATVICIYELSLFFESQGVARIQGMSKSGTITEAGIRVTMVDVTHSADIEHQGRLIPGGEAAGFVVELENGFRFYHAGDTGVFSDMKIIAELYKPELVMLPIGGHYTMGPREAAYACKLLKPRHIVGMHYGTFPILAGTPVELKKYLLPSYRKNVIELMPGKGVSIR